uniref:Cathepsin L-like proteinase n=1 Tax=Aceria tosichella TaxID=561515 RepID=A0A6G1S646_9ACAR
MAIIGRIVTNHGNLLALMMMMMAAVTSAVAVPNSALAAQSGHETTHTGQPALAYQVKVVERVELPRRSETPFEMFKDWRDSGCMLEPKQQGRCEASYAFAGITMAEFYFCKASHKLVEFSEQYLIDCGKVHIDGINGCEGGDTYAVPNFIHNFGLKLASNHRYIGGLGQCPYTDETNVESTGDIRMEFSSYLTVPVDRWEAVLHHSPIYVLIRVHAGFEQYKGGIYDGKGCGHRAHAMVVVGHGHEYGKEFWLLRNSYGTQWGEKGYFRLAKSAPAQCIYAGVGHVYGTSNGYEYSVG